MTNGLADMVSTNYMQTRKYKFFNYDAV